jgi:hypothetical protein
MRSSSRWIAFVVPLAGALLVSQGCGDDGPPPYSPPPSSVVVADPGPVRIRREVLFLDGVAPPPNPRSGAATPPDQNRFRLVRYRVDSDPPRPARAIVVMVPGFLAGAGGFDALARAVVRRSTEGEAFEAWAYDRRANLLEDTHGGDVAEVRGDPSLARKYYFDGEAVEGKTFDGFLLGSSYPWASEWGLATTLGDLRRGLADLVPESERKARIVLLGHSLGATLVEEYAAWDFDGTPGYSEIAGLVLLDGGARREGADASEFDRNVYANGGGSGGGFGPSLGVDKDVRGGNVFLSLPFFGVKAFAVAEYLALAARLFPERVDDDATRDELLGILLGIAPPPRLSNRAAFGFAFDEASTPLTFIAASIGEGNGGPVTPYESLLGATLVHPSDRGATYGWTEYDRASPPENTSVDDLARSFYEGPSLNIAEWYFPQRLPLDAQAAASLTVGNDDWRARDYGLRAVHGRAIDAPVLAVALRLFGDVSGYEAFRSLLPNVGEGRPNAGRGRSDDQGFRVIDQTTLEHVDGIAGADVPGSKVASWYDALVAFARANTPDGGIVVPVRNGRP